MEAGFEILCDFDGTIAPVDTVDFLLERLADPSWRLFEDQWIRGEIDSRECMAAQVSLLRGGWAAIDRALQEVRIDPGFAGFASWCRESGIPLRVVSEGIKQVVDRVLEREGIRVEEVWASRLVEGTSGGLTLRFPVVGKTLCGAAVCKCAFIIGGEPRPVRVLIGDGRSDFCISRHADLVFACSKLSIHCAQNDIAFVPFEGFDGVRRFLEDRRAVPPMRAEATGVVS
jgi:2-hydroxy-3-keto-5-methylthiopentenyl-1-phosphate phosphatase